MDQILLATLLLEDDEKLVELEYLMMNTYFEIGVALDSGPDNLYYVPLIFYLDMVIWIDKSEISIKWFCKGGIEDFV